MKNPLILAALIGAITLGSCKKSKNERRIEGVWKVTSFVLNGVDSTAFVTYSDIKGYKFDYQKPDDSDRAFHNIYEVKPDGGESLFGHWGERNNDQMFMGVEYKTENTGPFYPRHYHKYFDIEELKRKEMKYTLQDGNLFYEIEFEKI